MLITTKAKRAIDDMFARGIQASIASVPETTAAVTPKPEVSTDVASQIVALTVCSYQFRLMVMIYFSPDLPTREYIAALNRVTASDMDDQAFLDAIGEFGNICVGSVNRDMARVFSNVGMSTPNILDRRSALFLQSLGSDHIQHFEIKLGEGQCLHASLCLNAFDDLDFAIDLAEEETSGELEMF